MSWAVNICIMLYLWVIKQKIYNDIVNNISENLNCLRVINSDGTNTGHKTGIISRLESKIEQKCHWNVTTFFYTSILNIIINFNILNFLN